MTDALHSALAEAMHDEFWFHDMAHTPDGCGDLELPSAARILAHPAVVAALAGSEPAGLREALASGNYLQVYDHRQNRWLSPDEAVAAIERLAGSEPAGLDVERLARTLHGWGECVNDDCDGCGDHMVVAEKMARGYAALAATPTASPTAGLRRCTICGGWFEDLDDHVEYGHSGGRS